MVAMGPVTTRLCGGCRGNDVRDGVQGGWQMDSGHSTADHQVCLLVVSVCPKTLIKRLGPSSCSVNPVYMQVLYCFLAVHLLSTNCIVITEIIIGGYEIQWNLSITDL